MKQEIVCVNCVDHWNELKGAFPGEFIKTVPGYARFEFICDSCNLDIIKGDLAWAVSAYTDDNPYFSWEEQYLKIQENEG